MNGPIQSRLKLESQTVLWLAIAIIGFAVIFRVARAVWLPDLPNFSPVMAIAFCGAFLLPGWLAFFVPMVALVASDIFLNLQMGYAAVGSGEVIRYACYSVAIVLGILLRKRPCGVMGLIGAVGVNAVIFYVVTNTASWIGNPLYPQSAAGWVQALTIGLPGYAPTWTFFRNSLVSDLIFSAAFFGATAVASLPAKRPAVAA